MSAFILATPSATSLRIVSAMSLPSTIFASVQQMLQAVQISLGSQLLGIAKGS